METRDGHQKRLGGVIAVKLLFVVRGIFPDRIGGAPRHSYFLIKHLAELGCQIDVVHPSQNRHFGEYENVREFALPYGRTIFDFSRNVNHFIGERVYDVGYGDGLSLIRYLRQRKFPCVFNHHGFHMFQRQDFSKHITEAPKDAVREILLWLPRQKLCRYACSNSDYVISLGGKITHLLRTDLGVPEDKILELPNGVDLTIIPKSGVSAREPNSFLFVGGLGFRKGLTFLIRALNTLDIDFSCYIVGGGPLKARISDSNRNRNVKILGRVSDKRLFHLYTMVECFLLPSLQEGMPTVILEAMASHLPIIATDVGAISTMVRTENGFLIEARSAKAIVNAVGRFVQLPEERRRAMGTASRRIVEREFAWSNIARDYYVAFRQIAGGR